MASDIDKIRDAWDEEGSMQRLGLRPAADKTIQAALIPAGGDWQCVAPEGAMTRSVIRGRTEVALVNPRGDMPDSTEGDIAMGIRATPVMDKSLRVIFALAGGVTRSPDTAQDRPTLELIGKVARAAIAYVESPAPPIQEPLEEDTDQDEEMAF